MLPRQVTEVPETMVFLRDAHLDGQMWLNTRHLPFRQSGSARWCNASAVVRGSRQARRWSLLRALGARAQHELTCPGAAAGVARGADKAFLGLGASPHPNSPSLSSWS